MGLSDLAPGAVFARDYTVVRPLSEGGMGAVYVVQQTSTGAQRALKLMHAQLVREPRQRQRFEQEARVGARIESEHVVQVLGAGVDEATGLPFLVMELLHGSDLGVILQQRGALPPEEVRELFAQFTHAVAAAHRVGIVHRDLKPDNIFVAVAQREGSSHLVKVLDFGIAKVIAEAKTDTTQALGTPLWMAPEQTEQGRAITPATDVWALGLIAFRMFTGRHYWLAANSEQATPTMVLREVVMDPLVSASIRAQAYGRANLLPPGFDAWFERCVVRQPEARFEHAGAAREAFAAMMQAASFAQAGTMAGPAAAYQTGPATPGRAPMGGFPTGATPPGPVVGGASPGYAPAPAPMYPYGGAPILPVGAMTPVGPQPPRAPAPSGSSSRLVILGVVGLALLGGGLGVRALLRAQQVKACEAGKGDDLAAACLSACAAEPKRFCVVHGDLLRTRLTPASIEEASRSYEKGCKADDFVGCRKLGAIEEAQKNEAAAVEHFTRSCDGHDPGGCAWLARALERGRGVGRDAARASTLLDEACRDDAASCAFLAFNGESRPIPRPHPPELAALFTRAAPALRRECASGGLDECMALGLMQQTGRGVERDPAAAATSFHRACQGGLAEACNDESALELVGADHTGRAVDALRAACASGTAAACNNLAVLEAEVPFTLRQEQGVSLFRLACGDAIAFGCTQNGELARPPAGRPKNLPEAVTLLHKACADGLGVACVNLGALHENGHGVPRDRAQARAAYDKGCATGASEGCGTKESPFKKGEAWTGNYTCGQGLTDVTFHVLEPGPGPRTNAIFDFDYGKGQVVGRFLASGDLDPAAGTISFTPGLWLEQPAGWVSVGFHGQVSVQGTIFAGVIESRSCSTLRVTRMVSDVVAPRCPAGARFVEGHGCVPVPNRGALALGTWTGRGAQTGGSSWLITATVTSLESGRCGQVSYPTLGCVGDWYCVKSTDGKKLHAREIITTAGSRCDSTGFVDLTVADDNQSAEWRWSSPGRGGAATARLAHAATAP